MNKPEFIYVPKPSKEEIEAQGGMVPLFYEFLFKDTITDVAVNVKPCYDSFHPDRQFEGEVKMNGVIVCYDYAVSEVECWYKMYGWIMDNFEIKLKQTK